MKLNNIFLKITGIPLYLSYGKKYADILAEMVQNEATS